MLVFGRLLLLNKGDPTMKTFKRHISKFEKAALVIFYIVFLLMLLGQAVYGGGAVWFMAVTAVGSAVLTYLLFVPSGYEFHQHALVIVNPKPLNNKEIRYSDIIRFDTVGSYFAAKFETDSLEVLIRYRPNGPKSRKSVSCHPKNVVDFVETLEKHIEECEKSNK